MKATPFFLSALLVLPAFSQTTSPKATPPKQTPAKTAEPAKTAKRPRLVFKEAKLRATQEKKDVLMVFTAPAWQSRSQKFSEQIWSQADFQKGLSEHFVPAVFEVPKTRKEAHQDLLEFEQDYRFQGVPSVILTDSAGRPYAYSSTLKDTPADYLAHLKELHQIRVERDKDLAEARKLTGMPRAELIIKALKTLPQGIIRDFYAPELTQIVEADPDEKTTYVAEIEQAEALRQEKARYNLMFSNRQYDKIIESSQKEVAQLKGEEAQRVTMYGIQALYAQKKYDEAVEQVKAMKSLAPESEFGKKADQYVTQIQGAKERAAKMEEAAKNKKPSGPIVSKPVAIVSDLAQLKKDEQKAQADLQKAQQAEKESKKQHDADLEKVASLEKQLESLKATEKASAKALKDAVAAREKAARRAKAMREVVENHEAMEKRKRDVSALEKRAAELQKEAADLRKKAADLKKGK